MAPDDVVRIQALRQKISTAQTAKTRAEATLEQADAQLAQVLSQAEVATIEELESKLQTAQAQADEALRTAEAALA